MATEQVGVQFSQLPIPQRYCVHRWAFRTTPHTHPRFGDKKLAIGWGHVCIKKRTWYLVPGNSIRSFVSKDLPSGCSKRVCVCVHLHSESSELTFFVPETIPDEHPVTPPPSRWPALTTLPHLAKFQLVWRRLCVVVLFASCLFEHTLTAVCAPREY